MARCGAEEGDGETDRASKTKPGRRGESGWRHERRGGKGGKARRSASLRSVTAALSPSFFL